MTGYSVSAYERSFPSGNRKECNWWVKKMVLGKLKMHKSDFFDPSVGCGSQEHKARHRYRLLLQNRPSVGAGADGCGVPLPVPATCAPGERLAPAGATSRGLQGSALAQSRCVGLSWAASSILTSLVQGSEREHRVRCPSLGHSARCPSPPAAREAPPEVAAGCRALIPFQPEPFYVSEVVQDAEILCPSPSSPALAAWLPPSSTARFPWLIYVSAGGSCHLPLPVVDVIDHLGLWQTTERYWYQFIAYSN